MKNYLMNPSLLKRGWGDFVLVLIFMFMLPFNAQALQHDYVIDNQTFPAFRADLNNALGAGVSNNDGATEPTTTVAYMFWADTTAGIMKFRNAANNAWIDLWPLALGPVSNLVEDTTPQLGGHLDINGQVVGDGTRELLTFTEDGSAVNHVDIENQATGSGPEIKAAGDDTNVDLILKGKGTGNVALGTAGLKFPNADGTADQVLKTDGSGALSFATPSGGGGGAAESLSATNTNGPAILDEAASSTNPTLVHNKADLTSGIGGSTARIDFVVSGNEQLRLDANFMYLRNSLFMQKTSIAAKAGGGQSTATALGYTPYQVVVTAASAGDSIKFSTLTGGFFHIISNDTSNAVDLFPSTGHSINGLAANTAVSIPANSVVLAISPNATSWHVMGL
jgi:hypothetical protein